MKEHVLILFTRFPVAGKTKTRMIPHLGATGAAALQRELTEHACAVVAPLIARGAVDGLIQYTGGTREDMQAWLGDAWHYAPQAEGDLGERMATAFQNAFEGGAERVIIIGSDCPGIDTALLSEAYMALTDRDVVIGPATDGGYYLVGLHRAAAAKALPDLFQGPDWGTASVLETTRKIAERLALSVALLDEKRDVDIPEDLGEWERIRKGL